MTLSSGLDDITILNTNTHAHGLAFEPHSPDQKDVPWMLYRQRSQSVDAISSSSAVRSGAGMVAGAAASIIASAFGNHVQSFGPQDRQQQQPVPTRSPAPAPLGKKDVKTTENEAKTEQLNQPSSETNTFRQSSSSRPVLLPPSTPVYSISSGLTPVDLYQLDSIPGLEYNRHLNPFGHDRWVGDVVCFKHRLGILCHHGDDIFFCLCSIAFGSEGGIYLAYSNYQFGNIDTFRETRFYGKGQAPTIATAPRGPPRRNGKKGPRRPDSKAFFSNERTYMHWIKFGLLLGSMALTLLSFGKSMGLQVGLFLVLVAMASLVYATTIFHLRDRWMKQFRLDVLYYDRLGPSVLFMALFLAFATNVVLTVLKLMNEDGSDDGLNFYNGHQEGPLDI
ncbi:hypothetical protein BGZ96_009377 [Linnemannia gamsii]|uniref:DUF202 domain-containing protein n=1 Tax=Linnemannia gamsii TaxID=64522 RepID=A0ABQ7JWK2_9FUNG|nr:hypothetical protein BGZ96_009377 [Linnemannia gamsii]